MAMNLHNDISGWATRVRPEDAARYKASGVWRYVTLADNAKLQGEREADRVAVVEGERRATFGELLKRAQQLAAAFHALGLRPGDVIAFQLPNWIETMEINTAACIAGLVVNPIVPIYREAEVRYILRDARAKLVFIPQEFRGFDYPGMIARLREALPLLQHIVAVRGRAPGCTEYAALLAAGSTARCVPTRSDPDAVKLVLYTSGTTGSPKGVLHSHNSIMSEIDAVIAFWHITGEDVVLMPSPVTHITGYLYALEIAFAAGVKVVLMDRWNAGAALDLIDAHRVSFSVGATPFLKELTAEAERRGGCAPSLRLLMSGGAPVPPEVIYRANRIFTNCLAFRVYGSSEAPTVTLGIRSRAEADLGATTDGRIANHEVRLCDPVSGAQIDHGEGEICTRGPEMMIGYTNVEHTLEAFDADGYFHTGDLGYYVDGDCLCVSGRKKDLIIRGGENISPKEIEDVLHTHPGIRETAIVAMPHARLGEGVCAFVIPQSKAHIELGDIAAFLEGAGLARQKFPEHLEIVDDLPRTASGKVQKNLLRERIAAKLAAR
jgi:acyl-CoA synthetase (AMP-forming)/AMP-acid ligase II